MNLRINQGQAMRSVLGCSRVTHFTFDTPSLHRFSSHPAFLSSSCHRTGGRSAWSDHFNKPTHSNVIGNATANIGNPRTHVPGRADAMRGS
jgi:hypothetical protein